MTEDEEEIESEMKNKIILLEEENNLYGLIFNTALILCVCGYFIAEKVMAKSLAYRFTETNKIGNRRNAYLEARHIQLYQLSSQFYLINILIGIY